MLDSVARTIPSVAGRTSLCSSLLVDSDEFRGAMARDLSKARARVYLQAMSFEGDRAGTELTDLLLSSTCPDRRLVLDHFSRYRVSDRFVLSPSGLRDRGLREERRGMLRAVDSLRDDGVNVVFTNPMGPLLVRYPARNHKKLAIFDDVSYLGGINFSDHNFLWHDMMLRVDSRALADFLAADVEATCRGIDQRAVARFTGIEIHLLDGRTNEAGYDPVLRLMDRAQRSIFVESPYVTRPFLGRLVDACRRGVDVTMVAPRDNNHPAVAAHVARQGARSGMRMRLLPGMIHLKAMLVDGRVLVMGSSNLDVVSYRAEQEIVAFVTDPASVGLFVERVLEPDTAASVVTHAPGTWAEDLARRAQIGAAEIWSVVARSV